MENKIDFTIPDEVIALVTERMNEATSVLQPYLIALSPEERRTIPKMTKQFRLWIKPFNIVHRPHNLRHLTWTGEHLPLT